MTDPVRRIALYGFLGSGNLGNDASFETVLAWLRAEHPDVDVCCITIAPEAVRARYGVPSVPLTVYQPRPGVGRLATALGKMLGRMRDVPRSLALAGSVDAVVVPGMGVLEESLGVHPWGLPTWMFLLAAACRIRRRRFVLLGVGADPAVSPLTRRLSVATVRLATHVSYRDEWSAEVMRQAGAPPPDAVAPDVAFAHPTPAQAQPEPGLVVIGVMAYYGQRDDPVSGSDVRHRYVASVADAVGQLMDAGDRVVLLGGDQVDTDVAAEVRTAVRAQRPDFAEDRVLVRDVRTFTELSELMAGAEAVVASRFHNLICALRLARPTVSVGYAQKNVRLMRALELGGYCQDIESLDADELVAQLRRARIRSELLGIQIAEATRGYSADVASLLDRMATEALGLPCVEPTAAV